MTPLTAWVLGCYRAMRLRRIFGIDSREYEAALVQLTRLRRLARRAR